MTAQAPDKIIYKGKECSTYSDPMESYFDKYPDKRPEDETRWSSLWKGYIATFEIKDNQLFLKDIEINIYTEDFRSVMNEVFPNQELVKLDWYTGCLELLSGEMIKHVHMGYLSTFEHYTLLEIKNGDLIDEKQFGHEEYEDFKFQAFKKTDTYENLQTALQNIPVDDEFIIDDEFIKKWLQPIRLT